MKARTADLQRTNDAKRAEIDKIRATRSSNHTANETAHVTNDQNLIKNGSSNVTAVQQKVVSNLTQNVSTNTTKTSGDDHHLAVQ